MICSIFVVAFLVVSVSGQDPPGSCPPVSGEICLIIDTSDSISDETLSELFRTIGEYAGQQDVGTGCNQVQVAVVTFGRKAENPIGFNDYNDSASLAVAIEGLSRVADPRGTKTHKALNLCLELFSNDNCTTDDLIILVTDGTSGEEDKLTAAVKNVKAANISVIAIGVATRITKPEKLNQIQQQLLQIAFNEINNIFLFNSSSDELQLTDFLTDRIAELVQTCKYQKDVVFVLDYSKTIDDAEFNETRERVSSIVRGVECSCPYVRFGILVYGYGCVWEVQLGDSCDKASLLAKIADIKRLKQFKGTRTIKALGEACKMLNNTGCDAMNEIILITDGRTTDDKGQRLSKVRTCLDQKGIDIWGIGVGDRINRTELEHIVGDPTQVTLNPSSDDLDEKAEEINACACP